MNRMTMILCLLLAIFSLSGCGWFNPITGPPGQEPGDVCEIPPRPVIESDDIQYYQDDGDTWIAYRENANERLLIHIQELKNSLEACSNR